MKEPEKGVYGVKATLSALLSGKIRDLYISPVINIPVPTPSSTVYRNALTWLSSFPLTSTMEVISPQYAMGYQFLVSMEGLAGVYIDNP